jgi:3-hydroxyacyl-CoA dehydrogenase
VIGNQAGGMPGAFSAGGDLAFMAGLAKEGKYAEIDAFLKKAQTGMQKVRYASFPVVAAPYGLTLGGGCEVCLVRPTRSWPTVNFTWAWLKSASGCCPAAAAA